MSFTTVTCLRGGGGGGGVLLVVECCVVCAVCEVVNARPLGGIRWVRSTGLSSAIASDGLYMVAIVR